MSSTTSSMFDGDDLPAGKLVGAVAVIVLGVLAYFTAIKPAVRQNTLEERAERRAACSMVPAATESAIQARLVDLDGRVVRSMRAMPSTGGWWMVSANIAEPGVPRGFTGDLLTWRARETGGRLVVESVDRNAWELSTFPPAPDDVHVETAGAFDSRWCAKNAALSP